MPQPVIPPVMPYRDPGGRTPQAPFSPVIPQIPGSRQERPVIPEFIRYPDEGRREGTPYEYRSSRPPSPERYIPSPPPAPITIIPPPGQVPMMPHPFPSGRIIDSRTSSPRSSDTYDERPPMMLEDGRSRRSSQPPHHTVVVPGPAPPPTGTMADPRAQAAQDPRTQTAQDPRAQAAQDPRTQATGPGRVDTVPPGAITINLPPSAPAPAPAAVGGLPMGQQPTVVHVTRSRSRTSRSYSSGSLIHPMIMDSYPPGVTIVPSRDDRDRGRGRRRSRSYSRSRSRSPRQQVVVVPGRTVSRRSPPRSRADEGRRSPQVLRRPSSPRRRRSSSPSRGYYEPTLPPMFVGDNGGRAPTQPAVVVTTGGRDDRRSPTDYDRGTRRRRSRTRSRSPDDRDHRRRGRDYDSRSRSRSPLFGFGFGRRRHRRYPRGYRRSDSPYYSGYSRDYDRGDYDRRDHDRGDYDRRDYDSRDYDPRRRRPRPEWRRSITHSPERGRYSPVRRPRRSSYSPTRRYPSPFEHDEGRPPHRVYTRSPSPPYIGYQPTGYQPSRRSGRRSPRTPTIVHIGPDGTRHTDESEPRILRIPTGHCRSDSQYIILY